MSYVRLCGYVIKVDPLSVLTLDYALCTKDHAVRVILGESLENCINSLDGKLLCGLTTKAGEYLVGMVVTVVMAAAGAMLTVFVVMLVIVMMLVIMTTAGAMLTVFVVMLVIMTTAGAMLTVFVMMLVIMMMLVIVVMLVIMMMLVIVVMLVIMTTASAMLTVFVMMLFTVVMVVLVVVMMLFTVMMLVIVVMLVMVMLMLLFKCQKCGVKSILLLHSGENILAVKLVPRSSNDSCRGIMLSDKLNRAFNLLALSNVGMRKNYRGCVCNLIVIELAKVLHIHLALVNVGNGGEAVKLCLGSLYRLYRLDNVRELTNSAGLNDNSVGMELVKHLSKSLREISYKRAADTTRVHLCDLDTCILKESAVYTDLAEFVLDKHEFLARISFLNKLLDKSGLTGTEESGKNIYFRHFQVIAHIGQTSTLFSNIIIIHF